MKPKIGIALSGSSARLLAHVGVLEVLREHQIPIDYITACSSGGLVAASYATDTMEYLKQVITKMTWRKFWSLVSIRHSRGGIFHLNQAEEELNKITKDLNFEEIKHVKLGFTAADIYTGELITLTTGSLNQAIKATVAMPGLFEPVPWDDKLLVDGGLVNIVPTGPAKELGADLVIGIHLATANFIYEKKMRIWNTYRSVTKWLGLEPLRKKFANGNGHKVPNTFSVLAMGIEHSFRIHDEWDASHIACDLMIEPKVKHFGKAQFKVTQEAYLEGRRAAEEAIPQIKKLIDEFR